MLKNILKTLGILAVIGLSLFAYVMFAIQPAPNYNTIYTDQYKDDIFTKTLIGLTEEELYDVLGEPFTKDSIDQFHSYIVYQKNQAIALKGGGYGAVGDTGNHLTMVIDKNNTVTRSQYYDGNELKINQYVGKKFNPNDYSFIGKKSNEIKCDCACEVLDYTKSKDSYRGKHPDTHTRQIVLKDNKVYKIIKKDYTPNNFLDQPLYQEVCEIIDVK